jgi:hypothetical protein
MDVFWYYMGKDVGITHLKQVEDLEKILLKIKKKRKRSLWKQDLRRFIVVSFPRIAKMYRWFKWKRSVRNAKENLKEKT